MMSAPGPFGNRLARLEGAYQQIDKRLGDLLATMDARFAQVDARFAQIDARFVHIDARFVQIEDRIGHLEFKMDALQWRLTSLILVTWVTTMLAIFFKQ